MKRYFNTAGPCVPAKHYMIPTDRRLKGLDALIEAERYTSNTQYSNAN